MIKYHITTTSQYRKPLNRIVKRKKNNISELLKVIDCLVSGIKLAHKYKDHSLSKDRRKYGKYNARECHIENDFLLIYSINEYSKEISLIDVGTHSDLF